MSVHHRFRRAPLSLAGVGLIAGAALAAAPAALAAAPAAAATSGGAPVAPPAAHTAASSPFTIGLSAGTVKPGARLTVSGLAYARAGLNVTILSGAVVSAHTVGRIPAVQTPALVEGIYRTTVRIAPRARPGVYSVLLRFGNRQVAATRLRVVASGSASGGSTGPSGCAGIGFTVLHNDRAGSAYLPAGAYTVSSRNIDCATASVDFSHFLQAAGKPIAGWTTSSPAAGRATFTQRSTGRSFSVAKG